MIRSETSESDKQLRELGAEMALALRIALGEIESNYQSPLQTSTVLVMEKALRTWESGTGAQRPR